MAQLTAVMPMAAQEANLAACIGQDALMGAMETCQQLVQARSRIIATHAALRAAQTQIGLDAVNFMGNCPPEEARLNETVAPRRHLTTAA
ncbi:hypothetical protein [Sandarakinorhabdus limnophila]|uniref:hypothetical protein n=1 Tax=Sandarakinorhabdus limnophila TaxID=210512 RepID=UPI0026EF9828|nr:hypothetical protein [Sandarakinorhabdus limnophila]